MSAIKSVCLSVCLSDGIVTANGLNYYHFCKSSCKIVDNIMPD